MPPPPTKNIYGFDPRSVPGCQLWYDAADASSVLSTGNNVSVWQDKSGNGYDLTSVGTNPPTYSTTAFNGYPCIVFTSGQNQDMATVPLLMTTFIPPSAGYSYFAVFNQTGGTCSGLFFQQTGAASGIRGCEANGSNIQYDVNGTAYIIGAQNTNLLLSVVCNTGNQSSTADNGSIYVNGALLQDSKTFGTASFNYTDRVVLFAKDSNHSYRGFGYAAEFLQFNRALTSLERQEIEGYLSWKWGLSALGGTSTVLNYTGGDQNYVVPTGITSIGVYLWGAGGGGGTAGGAGALVMGNLSVTPGETLIVSVGAGGPINVYTQYSGNGNGGGGGRTAISRGSTLVVVAGGGGGGGHNGTGYGGRATHTNQSYSGGSSFSGQVLGRTRSEISALGGDSHNGGGGNTIYGPGQEGVDYGLGATGGGGYYAGGPGGIYGSGAASGGGGSSYTDNLTVFSGQSALGMTSADNTGPGNTIKGYVSGCGSGGLNFTVGGNGLAIIAVGGIQPASTLPSGHYFYLLPPFVRQFNPIDIDGCVLWLDGADGSSMSFSSGNNISQWFDKSGNGNSTTTTTGTSTWTTSAINGLNAVQFNSASWFLGPSVNNGAVVTVFAVGTMTGGNSGTGARTDLVRMVSLATPSTHDSSSSLTTSTILRYGTTTSISAYRSGSGDLSTGVVGLSTPFIACSQYNGTNHTMYVNGTAGTPVATSGNFGYTTYGIGSDPALDNTPWNGFVGEVIIYNAVLTTIQRQQVEGYLAKKWNIEIGITNPKLIPSCVLWVDSSDITGTGLPVSNGTTITNWVDKTGLNTVTSAGNTVTKSTLGVVFSGSYFTITGSLVGSIVNTPFVIFVVETLGSGGYFFGDDTVTGQDASLHIGYRSSTQETFAFYADDLEDYSVSGTGYTRVWTFYLPTSNNRVTRRNGAIDVTHGNYNRLTAFVTPVIGRVFGGNYYSGTISEIIVYNTDIGLTRIKEIESYLLKKWQVTGTSVYNHPYVALPPSSTVPFIPTNIATCALWLDGADPLATGIAPANSTSITTWFDKSGNGYNATASSAATYSDAYNAVYFNNNLYSTTYTAAPTAETAFIVFSNPNVNTNTAALISGYSGARGIWCGYSSGGSGSVGVLSSQIQWNVVTGSGTVASGQTTLVTEQINSGNSYIALKGSSTFLSGGTNFSNGTVTYLGRESGGSYGYVGYAMEILFYSSVLSTAQRQQVEGYLANKWNLSKSLPTSHAYYNFEPSIPPPVTVAPSDGLYSFTTFTFTNCGQTGYTGPTISQCTSTYSTASWTANTAYFNMTTTGYQRWTVPSTGPYIIVAAGAGGTGGSGAVITSKVSLTQGDIVNIAVGQQGQGPASGGCSSNPYGGSGGTFVVNTNGTAYVIAGGSGGNANAHNYTSNMNARTDQYGQADSKGNNGNSSGGNGGSGGNNGCCCGGGGGGGYTGNGGAGYNCSGGSSYTNGLTGGTSPFTNGGFGGGGACFYGGGGGGGYSGGAGGGLNSCSCGDCQGGGGGGSYSSVTPTSTSVSNNGMGYVTITKQAFGPPDPVTVSSTDTFLATAVVSWSLSYQAVTYTVKLYLNASNSTTGGTLLGTATTANLTYTFTGLTFAYYTNFLMTTFYANTGSIPNSSGPTDAGGNGNNWGSIIQSAQALNPIYFGNNLGVYIAGQGNYSALTTGFVYSASAGTIQFQGITDDGLIVNFNGSNVINQYQQQGSTTYYSGSLTLPAGYTPIRITWYDTGGGGDYRIYFSINGGAYINDGTGVFYHQVPATTGYVYATVFATNSTPTNSNPATSATLQLVPVVPYNIVNVINLSAQTVVTTWSFADNAYVTNYTLKLYTNTSASTSGATLVSTITTTNLTYTFSGLSLVQGNYLFTTIYATGSVSTTSTIYSTILLILLELYSFTTITLTPCGATGRNGPTLSQCVSAYSGSNSWVTNTSYFNMTTQGYQLWTVPSSKSYTFVVAGARGGIGSLYGKGGVATVSISLTKGDVIRIVVGQIGTTSRSPCGTDHGGGGGGTYVYNNTTSTLLIAIGGGGGGSSENAQNSLDANVLSTSGNSGQSNGGAGGSAGNGGSAGSSGCTSDFGGGGGGYSSNGGSYGGNGGSAFVNGSVGGAGSSYGAEGGFGGGAGGSNYNGNGGGGYSGGGGGALSQCSCGNLGGGGGGGSYFIVAPTSSDVTNTADGYVTIS